MPRGIKECIEDDINIPVSHAERVCKDNRLDQVIIIGRKVGENGYECLTTYGKNKENCKAAAIIGDFLKYKVMGWDE
ncbi:MAG: hypothetical protein GOVbin631_50 [Prokaryotic dsDNA virus sp.]|nr:MAG: hypothetical protein GOVbin631_50 [Prokaryotic dsDNA virus sp.]|tara:strand:- start:20605 stop:20835 length:231 start_codon:yes stop_codon:yes gene_type:complete